MTTRELQWQPHPTLFKAANTWPADKELLVIVRFRNGHVTRPAPVKSWRWWRFPNQREPLPTDIVAWAEA